MCTIDGETDTTAVVWHVTVLKLKRKPNSTRVFSKPLLIHRPVSYTVFSAQDQPSWTYARPSATYSNPCFQKAFHRSAVSGQNPASCNLLLR